MPDTRHAAGRCARVCSVVIPVYNRAELTRQCLEAIRKNTRLPGYEVVVVDNGSTDSTAEMLAGLEPPFRSIRNEENLGFAKACNAGARASSAKYVLFLNNDTIPLAGWLEPMVDLMEERPEVGIVGSKLLYPNDLIQHAGVAFVDSSPYHIWRFFPSDFPEANVEKEMEAVTGACMLVRRSLFDELGGFDTVYVNGLEDIDLCLRARELGQRIVYCPRSVAYHFEGMTEGRTDNNGHNSKLYMYRWAGRKITTQPVMKHYLARIASSLLKTNGKGDRFVLFHAGSLIRCDRNPPACHVYRCRLTYYMARVCYALRYVRYWEDVRKVQRQAASATVRQGLARQCLAALGEIIERAQCDGNPPPEPWPGKARTPGAARDETPPVGGAIRTHL